MKHYFYCQKLAIQCLTTEDWYNKAQWNHTRDHYAGINMHITKEYYVPWENPLQVKRALEHS